MLVLNKRAALERLLRTALATRPADRVEDAQPTILPERAAPSTRSGARVRQDDGCTNEGSPASPRKLAGGVAPRDASPARAIRARRRKARRGSRETGRGR